MAILKVKLVNASDQPLSGQTVKVTGCGELQTNAEGIAQFLMGAEVSLDIHVNGALSWSGKPAELAREELFKQNGSAFVRVIA